MYRQLGFPAWANRTKKEVLGKLSDLNNSINKSKYSKILNDTMHFYSLCIYFVFTMKIEYIAAGFH